MFMRRRGMEVCSKRGPRRKDEEEKAAVAAEEKYVDFDYYRSKAIMVARLYPERKEQLKKSIINGPVKYQLFSKW
jgi:hypothetical protein